MSDFLNQQQCDELVNGQTYNGEYVPTDQDLADMAEAWGSDEPFEGEENLFCADCGQTELVGNAVSPNSSLCNDCYDDCAGYDCYDMTDDEPENFFCANCGHVELVGNTQSPDDSLCCDCYKYTTGDDEPDYPETEADTYQDHSYYDDFFQDDYPEMDW